MAWPLSFVVDSSKSIVVVTYHEQPAIAQWTATMQEVFADASYRPHYGLLLDRRMIQLPAETEYIRRMVSFIDRHRKTAVESRWAILVGDTGSYGMGRMAEQLSDNPQSIRTFRLLADAVNWLTGGSPDAVQDL